MEQQFNRRKNQFASKYVFRRHLHFFVSIRHAMGKRRKFVFLHKLVYDKVILQTKWKAIYDITKDKRGLEPYYHSFIFESCYITDSLDVIQVRHRKKRRQYA